MKRFFTTAAGIALATALTVGGALAQSQGGTLVQITQPEPPNLAPYVSTSGPIAQVTSKVFDGLLEYDFNLQPQPSLANSWTVSPDGLTITFNLRDDVVFHDGTPLTSEDVRFTVMDVLKQAHPRGIATFKNVTAVETPDPHTAIFRLDAPAPYIMMALHSAESPILPAHIYAQGDIRAHANANEPIGSGPFRFVEWRRGEIVRLDRNDNYWRDGQPYLDRIVVRFIADASTRTAVLEQGEAHVAGFGAVPYQDVRRLEALDTIEVTTRGYEMISPIVEMIFNTQEPPFDNAKVRQAVNYAIDRQFVIDNVWFGYGTPASGPISSNFEPAGLFGRGIDFSVPDRIEIANRLLDEAGFPRGADGIRFEITHDVTPYGEEWQRFGEITVQNLAEIGIKANIRYEDLPTWLSRTYTDYAFQLTSNFLFNQADPVIGVHRGIHSDRILPGTVFVNGSRWSSPETDALMDAATVATDAATRSAAYQALVPLVSEASPVAYVLELNYPTVLSTKFADVITSPIGIYGNYAFAHQR